MTANAFEVLRLDPKSSEAEIVSQAEKLRLGLSDETERIELDRAVGALTGNQRRLEAMLTHANPEYANPLLEQLINNNRSLPAADETVACPPLDKQAFVDLILDRAAEEAALTPGGFETVSADEDAAEIDAQLAEAAWHCLIHDLGERPSRFLSSPGSDEERMHFQDENPLP